MFFQVSGLCKLWYWCRLLLHFNDILDIPSSFPLKREWLLLPVYYIKDERQTVIELKTSTRDHNKIQIEIKHTRNFTTYYSVVEGTEEKRPPLSKIVLNENAMVAPKHLVFLVLLVDKFVCLWKDTIFYSHTLSQYWRSP